MLPNSSCDCPWDSKLAKSPAILWCSNNNTRVQYKTFKLMCCVPLYWLEPRRCVPLEAGHVFSNRGLICFSLNSQMKIYIPGDFEHVRLCVYVCTCDAKSQGVMGTEWECVAEIHHSCSAYPGRHGGGSHRAEQSVCQFATAVAPLHSKLGFSQGTSHCVLQAHMGCGISMSTMHDHILCLGLGTQVDPSHAHQRSNVTTVVIMPHLICWPATSEVVLKLI